MSNKSESDQYLVPGGMGWGLRSEENSAPKIVFQDKEQAIRYAEAKFGGRIGQLVILEKNGSTNKREIAAE